MKLNRTLGVGVVAIALALVASSAVADVNFPRMDGADISRAESWGGTLPGPGDTVVFTGLTQTVTCSNDVEFGTLWNGLVAGSNELTFDLRGISPVPTLKFDGFRGARQGAADYTTRFRGGIYDFNGKGFAQGGSKAYYGNGRNYYLTDGVVVTNVANVTLGYMSNKDLHIELSGGSKLYVDGGFTFTEYTAANYLSNWIKVTGGSYLRFTGAFTWETGLGGSAGKWSKSMELQPDGAMYFKDMIEVSGEGSELEIAAADGKSRTITGGRGGSKIIVTDGGKFTVAKAAYCWSGYARNVLIQVSNGGQIRMGSTVYCGANGDAECGNRHNRIEVLSGGSFTVNNGTFYFGDGFHSGQSLVVSNGTFQSADFKLGNDVSCSNNIVVVQGPNAVFTPYTGTRTWTMFTAPFCEYRVELGARYAPPSSYFGGSAKVGHSTLRVRNGGILDVGPELRTSISDPVHSVVGDSYSHGIVAASNNCIIAESGGIVTGKTINVGGRACSLRVDDSFVSLTNTADSLVIGYDNKYGGAGTNCVLEIAGSRPAVRLSGNLKFQYVSNMKFELPTDGYEADAKPVVAEGAVSIGSPCRLVFTGAAEMLASHTAADKNGEYVLIENPQAKTFVSDAVVEAAQAELAEVGSDLKLFKRVLDSRNQLVLRVKGHHPGLMMIVK